MHATTPAAATGDFAPDSPEEALLLLTMRVGRRMRLRHPGDEVDAATIPLLHLLSCTGDIRLSDLASRSHLDASTISRHARQLEERGMIVRTEDPDDGRASRVGITDLGAKTLTACIDQRKRRLAEALTSWSARDREALQRLATRFVTDLDAGDGDE